MPFPADAVRLRWESMQRSPVSRERDRAALGVGGVTLPVYRQQNMSGIHAPAGCGQCEGQWE